MKIAAAVLVIAVGLVIAGKVKQDRIRQVKALTAQSEEQGRIAALLATARQAEVDRLRLVQMHQVAQAQRQLYRCVDGSGTQSIQDEPCAESASVTGRQTIQVETPLEASLRQQEWVRQEGEARLRQEEARFAAATGANNSGQVYIPGTTSTQSNSARCQSAKNERDQAYRIAGNDRSFDFIRRWDDYVYEACNGT